MAGKGQYVYGRCPFCAAKGYPRRRLIQTPDGLRCGMCMALVESLDVAITRMTEKGAS